MHDIACPLWKSRERVLLFALNGDDLYLRIIDPALLEQERYWYACEACGFLYRLPSLTAPELDHLYAHFESMLFKDVDPDEYFDGITSIPDGESENLHKTLWLGQVLAPRLGERSLAGLSVLDAGCGCGTLLHAVRSRLGCRDLAGLEPNRPNAELASRRLDAPVLAEPFAPGRLGRPFDVVMSTKVLEHVPDPVGFLGLLRRDVAEDGFLFVEVPGERDFFQLPPEHKQFMSVHLHFFTPRTLAAALALAGLEVLELREVVTPRNRSFIQSLSRPAPGVSAPPPPYDDPQAFARRLAEHHARTGQGSAA